MGISIGSEYTDGNGVTVRITSISTHNGDDMVVFKYLSGPNEGYMGGKYMEDFERRFEPTSSFKKHKDKLNV